MCLQLCNCTGMCFVDIFVCGGECVKYMCVQLCDYAGMCVCGYVCVVCN